MITVYCVVLTGVAVGLGNDALFNVLAGVQLYVSPPPAFSCRELLRQIASAGSTKKLFEGRIFTWTESELIQPAALVTITLYFVGVIGVATGFGRLASFNDPEGVQL